MKTEDHEIIIKLKYTKKNKIIANAGGIREHIENRTLIVYLLLQST